LIYIHIPNINQYIIDIVYENEGLPSDGDCKRSITNDWKIAPKIPGSKKLYATPGWVRKIRIKLVAYPYIISCVERT
jgi:hypothetical protein